MTIWKFILLTTLHGMIASMAFGSQDSEQAPWMTTVHGADKETLAALKQTTQSLERTAATLKQATQDATIHVGISTENGIRLTGMGMALLATASILYSNELNEKNGTALSAGLAALFGARNMSTYVEQQSQPSKLATTATQTLAIDTDEQDEKYSSDQL